MPEFGENLGISSDGGDEQSTLVTVLRFWKDELKTAAPASDTADPVFAVDHVESMGHVSQVSLSHLSAVGWVSCMLQMLWAKTSRVGCALATCSEGNLVFCHYQPPLSLLPLPVCLAPSIRGLFEGK